MKINKNAQLVIVATIGTALTYYLNISLELGPMVASGLVGLLAALFLPTDLAIVAYTAAFAGMSASFVLVNYYMVTLTGFFVGIIFIITQPIYQGFGGKLGTIAACSVILSVMIFSIL